MSADAPWMRLAVEAARRGLGGNAPRPSVGAVLVRDGRIIGVGTTQPAGPHAEPTAIADALARGEDPRGATIYVTLEPCCHVGRTGPCTEAILAAGISRVVVGIIDANPLVNGAGVKVLRDRGISVEVGVEAEACATVHRGFIRAMRHGLPEVTAKAAISLDGHLATAGGESAWISGELSRAHAHTLRASHDAILVGVGTVLADDPRLTARVSGAFQPVPVVLDRHLRTPPTAALFQHSRRPLILCNVDAPDVELPADIVRLPEVNAESALRALCARGLHRILVEGGAKIHGELIRAKLVDTLVLYVAPILIPGGLPWLVAPELAAMADAPRFGAPLDVERFGDDVAITYGLPHVWAGVP